MTLAVPIAFFIAFGVMIVLALVLGAFGAVRQSNNPYSNKGIGSLLAAYAMIFLTNLAWVGGVVTLIIWIVLQLI